MNAATATATATGSNNMLMHKSSAPNSWFRKPSRIHLRRRRSVLSLIVKETSTAAAQGRVSEEAPPPPPAPSASRRLILLRHAHSSSPNPSLRDHDRPLSKSGRVDAEKVARKLEQMGWIPNLILCSNAVRSRETLKIMQECVAEMLKAEVHFLSSFYSIAAMDGQTADHLQQAICQYDNHHTVMCMGHNRGWEEAASMFTGVSIELKNCNAALLEATGKSWKEAFDMAGLGGWKLQGIVRPT